MVLDKLPPFSIGGAEVQALRLARALQSRGVAVTFLTPGRDNVKGKGLVEEMPVYRLHSLLNYPWDWAATFKKKMPVKAKVKIEYDDSKEVTNQVVAPMSMAVRMRYTIFLLNAMLFFARRGKEFQIIHVHSMEWPSFVGASLARWFGKRLVIKDATMNGIFGLARFPRGEQKLRRIVHYGHFIAMTRAILANFLKAGVPRKSISQIPNGIEVAGSLHKATYRKELSSVIFVGNLGQQPAKGIDILLKAWVDVHARMPGAILQIVGEGPVDEYQAYSTSIGLGHSVVFMGKRSDITKLLIDADVFVLPSRREGMPNALMEAMLAGLPSIATDISGCQDLISNGLNGVLVAPVDINGLSAAIESLLNNAAEAERMGRAARETMVNEFSLDRVAGLYKQLYQDLLDNAV